MVATISIFTRGSSQQTLAEVGHVGGPRFASQEGRVNQHQHQPAPFRTELPKAPTEASNQPLILPRFTPSSTNTL